VPRPPTTREKIQESFVREQQIDPKKYYPNDYDPHLLEEWPVGGDLVVPLDVLPDNLKDSMGDAWRLRKKIRRFSTNKAGKKLAFHHVKPDCQ
jgi:ribonuclease Z